MKKVMIVLVGILVIIFVLSVSKDMIIKAATESGVEMVTGLKLRIESFKVGFVKTIVDIKNLTLFNPAGYKDSTMCKMPEIYVQYDLPAIIGGTIHLQELRINLSEFIVVKNEKGELNLDALNVVKEQKGQEKPKEKKEAKMPKMKIDSLQLKIGKVIYKDYSAGGEPSVKEFNVNIDEKYSNITDPSALASIIVVKALMNTTIASLTNFDLQGLKGTVTDTLATAGKMAAQVSQQAQQALGKTVQVTGQAAQGAEKVLGDTAEVLKNTLSLPFGSKEKK